MRRSDYEWVNYVGGDCGLRHRKTGTTEARIAHIEQGLYEALLMRREETSSIRWLKDPVSLGVFNSSEEAEAVIEKVLEDVWEK